MNVHKQKKRGAKHPHRDLADPWIKKYSSMDARKLHALGVITLAWNGCEMNLLALFIKMARVPPRVGWIISHDLGDASLSERIIEIAKLRAAQNPQEHDILDAVLHVVKVYNDCRQNRNTLTHVKMVTFKGSSTVALVRMKGPSMEHHRLPDKLSNIRRVAREIRELSVNLRHLWESVDARYNGKPSRLPKKLPRRTLLWKSPPKTTMRKTAP